MCVNESINFCLVFILAPGLCGIVGGRPKVYADEIINIKL